mgnify:CR=1 FL=1
MSNSTISLLRHWRPSTCRLLCINVNFGYLLVYWALIWFGLFESLFSTESTVSNSFSVRPFSTSAHVLTSTQVLPPPRSVGSSSNLFLWPLPLHLASPYLVDLLPFVLLSNAYSASSAVPNVPTSSVVPKSNSSFDSTSRTSFLSLSPLLRVSLLPIKFSMSTCYRSSILEKCWKLSRPRGLVKILIVCGSVGTYTSSTSPERTRSWTKW